MTQARVFTSVGELRDAVGQEIGPTEWFEIDQKRIDQFAEATGDHQWIHVDPEKAAAGPFGTTIAHGYLTLSLIPFFTPQLFRVEGISMGVNYGVNKVRFPSPVPVGSRLRASARLADVSDVKDGVQLVAVITVEREGGEKPVCVAETVVRFYL
ncbi:MaoC family dehydratase [Streptomyces sp. SL13]|jgi:acyl dehydratase|uniref:MaoC family dehydratase n=1 Tax=Streptantibioticus silvisoli TaxID=2705255 RepID=A0AA90H9X3_9ACTN|nr:MaoC family dehydratase [Streptantibioticus silvisoli]MDI5966288.1 MaoC family dehydratase [Streptantibioticus silvisoli]MDI5971630.1 MaoC family dehydratase [Streptantibioticus silvisoli]